MGKRNQQPALLFSELRNRLSCTIVSHFVSRSRNGFAPFDCLVNVNTPPCVDQMSDRRDATLERFPWKNVSTLKRGAGSVRPSHAGVRIGQASAPETPGTQARVLCSCGTWNRSCQGLKVPARSFPCLEAGGEALHVIPRWTGDTAVFNSCIVCYSEEMLQLPVSPYNRHQGDKGVWVTGTGLGKPH